MQEAAEDVQHLAKSEKDSGSSKGGLERKPKRKVLEDPVLSAQKPRKLFHDTPAPKDTVSDEEEDEDGRDDVPTPTSSPCLEASDKEDGDIFRGKFGGKEDARTPKPDFKPRHADASTPLPKPAAAPDFSQKTPSSQINSWPEDVRDMLCTLDDPLLQSLPSTFSAPLASSNDFAVLLPGVRGTCMLLRADFRNVLGILTEEEILTHVDAMDCFLFGDCYMLAT